MSSPIPVHLAPYDPNWPRLAAGHAERIDVIGPVLLIAHHIGSTSVPGLAAKPIIDLMPVVTDLAVLDCARQNLEGLGYRWHGELGIPGRRYCSFDNQAGVREAQLHFFGVGSPHIERHLAFRDYLRAHPQEAAAYEAEKRRARDLHSDDSHAYNDEKDAWIREREVRALNWFADQKRY